jgi:glycerol-3-phosphate acyltransferase PlsY
LRAHLLNLCFGKRVKEMNSIILSFKGDPLIFTLVILVSYVIGNLSPATLVSRAAGIDIRREGSGNPGTTNVLRVMGKKAALVTLLIDVLKGVAAVMIGRYAQGEPLAVLSGLFVFAGHIWPVFLRFKGGKGIATGLGVLLALSPVTGLLCLSVAGIGFLLSKRVSVGSLAAALSLPLLASYYMKDYIVIFILMMAIVFLKHRGNIVRLLKGAEPKTTFKR